MHLATIIAHFRSLCLPVKMDREPVSNIFFTGNSQSTGKSYSLGFLYHGNMAKMKENNILRQIGSMKYKFYKETYHTFFVFNVASNTLTFILTLCLAL